MGAADALPHAGRESPAATTRRGRPTDTPRLSTPSFCPPAVASVAACWGDRTETGPTLRFPPCAANVSVIGRWADGDATRRGVAAEVPAAFVDHHVMPATEQHEV